MNFFFLQVHAPYLDLSSFTPLVRHGVPTQRSSKTSLAARLSLRLNPGHRMGECATGRGSLLRLFNQTMQILFGSSNDFIVCSHLTQHRLEKSAHKSHFAFNFFYITLGNTNNCCICVLQVQKHKTTNKQQQQKSWCNQLVFSLIVKNQHEF